MRTWSGVLALGLVATLGASRLVAQKTYPVDSFPTAAGDLRITFIGHASLMFQLGPTVIHVDPVGNQGDYTSLPKADLVFVTHDHGDHFDPKAIAQIRKPDTTIVVSESCASALEGATVMRNGQTAAYRGVKVEAVPAYNVEHVTAGGAPYHPKGRGNGYVFTLGGLRVYVAGDTENVPEVKALKAIDVAFLPMNLPFTMTPEMVVDAVRAFKPKVLYPYHYSEAFLAPLTTLMKGVEGVELRVHPMR
jgi:L-ascorbate metabolism protein UlaG (beta-lactamase superfamily)